MSSFSDYIYYPCVRSRASELQGLSNLREESIKYILPTISLCRAGKGSDIHKAFDKISEAYQSDFIIDLTTSSPIALEDASIISSPENNYESWINYLKSKKELRDDLIPSALISEGSTKRQFVRQVMALEEKFGKIAVRINPLQKKGMQAATLAASAVDDIDNVIFIIDVGQISNERQRPCLDACIRGINSIREIEDSSEIVITGSSFPRAFADYGRTRGSIPMLERQNYKALGGDSVAIYGDYAGIHGEFYPGSYAKFVARIDYPTPGHWIFERRAGDQQRERLYQQAAQEIINDEEWDDELNAWGAQRIREAASGSNDGMNTPSKWISVRLNLHIERMIQFINNDALGEDPFDGDIGWEDDEELI